MLKKNKFLRLFLISFAITFALTAVSTVSIYAYTTSKGAVNKDVKAGQKALEANDFKKAESLFKSALDKDKYSAPARIGLADTLVKLNEPDEAISLLQKGINLVPGNYEYYIALLKTYVKIGKMDEAFSFLNSITNSNIKKKLAEKQPDNITADPAPQAADKPLNVKLTSSKNTTIYYTIDGKTPWLTSTEYTKPIEITAKITLKAFAIDENGVISDLFSGLYNVFNGTKEYKFSDGKIETIVRTRLNRPSGAIYLNDLVKITSLANKDNNGKPIAGNIVLLDDLTAFSGLTELSLEDEPLIADFTPLSNMTNLKRLTLNGCSMDDNKLAKLVNLKNLVYLSIERNNISTLANLSGLTKLKTICAANNRITDISPVQSLTALESLDVSKNGVENISALTKMTSLKEFIATDNLIVDITPLAPLKGLITLNISTNRICTLNGIQNMSSLSNLNASHNTISDLSALNGNTSIAEINLSGNTTLSDLTPLTSTRISKVTITDCNLSTIDKLAAIPELVYLNVSNNGINDLSPLNNAQKLVTLDIKSNSVSTLLPLRDCQSLRTVYCSGNLLTSDNSELNGTGIQVYKN